MQAIVRRAFASSVDIASGRTRVVVHLSTSCRHLSGRTRTQASQTVSLCHPPVGLAPHRLQHTESSRHQTMTRGSGTHHGHASKRVLVPIANGTEEMEAVIIIDVLRRAGAEVVVASVEDELQVTCARQTKLVADESITSAAKHAYDMIVLPGGMPGAERLRDCATLEKLLHAQRDAQKPYAAICASPVVVLEAKGLLGPGVKATAHPAMSDGLKDQSAVHQRVVVDKGGLLVTSRGPGTAFEFSLELVKQLYGEDKMKAVAGPMVMHAY